MKLARTPVSDAQRASIVASRDPAEIDEAGTECGAESACDVGTVLGPIEALPGEGPARAAEGIDVDAKVDEPSVTRPAEFVVAFAAGR